MGFYVGVNLSFSCNSLWRLKEVASCCLADHCDASWDKDEYGDSGYDRFNDSYTKRMLEQVANNTEKYIHYGNKGDMFIWGGVWNYYSASKEIPYLITFFKRMWGYCEKRGNIIFDFDKILLVVNPEQSEESELYEFSIDEQLWEKEKKIEVVCRKSISELNWNQM